MSLAAFTHRDVVKITIILKQKRMLRLIIKDDVKEEEKITGQRTAELQKAMMWLIEPSPYEGRYTRFIMK
jgi:hypothetical protein